MNAVQMEAVPRLWDRFWARTFDEIFIFIITWRISYKIYESLQDDDIVFISWKTLFLLLVLRMAYEVISVWLYGTTPGKWLFNIYWKSKAEPEAVRLPFIQILLRVMASHFSLFFSYAPFAFALFRFDGTHLIDWIAKTRMVQTRNIEQKNNKFSTWARPRPIIASFLIIYFGLVGASQAFEWIDGAELTSEGLFYFFEET